MLQRRTEGTPLVRSHTHHLPEPVDLLELLPAEPAPSDVCAWVRNGQGLVGWGRATMVRTHGPTRFEQAQDWWQSVGADAVIRDEVGVPGTGPVAFGSLSYAAGSPAGAILVVPRVVVGRRDGHSWITTIETDSEITQLTGHPAGIDGTGGSDPSGAGTVAGNGAHYRAGDRIDGRSQLPPALRCRLEPRPAPPAEVTFSDGALSGPQWTRAVAQAVRMIVSGRLDKVVLARDLRADASEPIDPRQLLRYLATEYGRTWVFAVDGLLGATPELLVRLERGLVTSRVLAGTIRRTRDDDHDLALAASLARSSKDLEEHEYAVRSVAEALARHCTSINVPESPYVLHLPNVMHLATDITGRLNNGDTSLGLAATLHPSAAVCGTPRAQAEAVISELEGMDRGRYAGPVGWMDVTGDGEWGIALRSGQLDPTDPRRIRLFAGCGIVAGSDPAAELAESDAKLVPMRSALHGRTTPASALDDEPARAAPDRI